MLFNAENMIGYLPNPTDVYDPSSYYYLRNNTNYGKRPFRLKLDWIIADGGYNGVDLRLYYPDMSPEDWG